MKVGDKAIPINLKGLLGENASNIIEYVYGSENASVEIAPEPTKLCEVVAVTDSHVVLRHNKKLFVVRLSQVKVVEEDNKEDESSPPKGEDASMVNASMTAEPDDLKPKPGLRPRLTNVVLRKGHRRPSVFLLQEALKSVGKDLKVTGMFDDWTHAAAWDFQEENSLYLDGEVGRGTWPTLLSQAYAAGFKPDLVVQIMEVVAWAETSTSRDVYGFAENEIRDRNGVPDGGGANYGVVQNNKLGSMVDLLTLAGRPDLLKSYNSTNKSVVNWEIKEWVGSEEGVRAQNEYFRKYIYEKAVKNIPDLGLKDWETRPMLRPYWERLVTFLCDCQVQSGTFFSRKRPFWKTLEPEYSHDSRYRELFYGKEWDALLGEYVTYDELKEAWFSKMQALGDKDNYSPKTNRYLIKDFLKRIPDPETKLVFLAQWHSRSNSARWWKVVASRRMLIATDEGTVNEANLRLYEHFGIGIDR